MGRQLALSEALLAGLAERPEPALRWYVTSREALALGNGQRPQVVNEEAAHARGVGVFRRTSGGTAVLVDANALSMEVALPAGHALASSDIVKAYRWLGEVWAEALRSLGVAEARAIPTDEVRALPALAKDDPVRLACYGTLSPWEVVVVGERKLVGLCQLRRRAGVLYQAGVHFHWAPERLVSLLALPEETRTELVQRLRTTTIGLDEAAGRSLTPAEVIAAVEASIEESHGVTLTPGDWRADELARAEEIERERFSPL